MFSLPGVSTAQWPAFGSTSCGEIKREVKVGKARGAFFCVLEGTRLFQPVWKNVFVSRVHLLLGEREYQGNSLGNRYFLRVFLFS